MLKNQWIWAQYNSATTCLSYNLQRYNHLRSFYCLVWPNHHGRVQNILVENPFFVIHLLSHLQLGIHLKRSMIKVNLISWRLPSVWIRKCLDLGEWLYASAKYESIKNSRLFIVKPSIILTDGQRIVLSYKIGLHSKRVTAWFFKVSLCNFQ